jgi:hypothetical protein
VRRLDAVPEELLAQLVARARENDDESAMRRCDAVEHGASAWSLPTSGVCVAIAVVRDMR